MTLAARQPYFIDRLSFRSYSDFVDAFFGGVDAFTSSLASVSAVFASLVPSAFGFSVSIAFPRLL
jgi:hypothetical protein